MRHESSVLHNVGLSNIRFHTQPKTDQQSRVVVVVVVVVVVILSVSRRVRMWRGSYVSTPKVVCVCVSFCLFLLLLLCVYGLQDQRTCVGPHVGWTKTTPSSPTNASSRARVKSS